MTYTARENAALRAIEAIGPLTLETQSLLLCAIKRFRAVSSSLVNREVGEHINEAICCIADDKREQEAELQDAREFELERACLGEVTL